TAAAAGNTKMIGKALSAVAYMKEGRFPAAAAILDVMDRRKVKLTDPGGGDNPYVFLQFYNQAAEVAADEKAEESDRPHALARLGREEKDWAGLRGLLTPRSSPRVQSAALQAMGRLTNANVADFVLAGWKGYGPTQRDQALDVLMGRPAWLNRLLTALEKK